MRIAKPFLSVVILCLPVLLLGACGAQPGTIKGEDLFEKSILYRPPKPIYAFGLEDSAPDSTPLIALLDTFGELQIIDEQGKLIETRMPGHFYAELRSDGSVALALDNELSNIEQQVRKNASLRSNGFRSIAMRGDVDGDNVREWYLFTEKGFSRFSPEGKIEWTVETPVLDEIVFDSGQNEKRMIITLGGRDFLLGDNLLQFWNAKGELLRKANPPAKTLSTMELSCWPSGRNILAAAGRSFYVLDFDGKVILKQSLTHSIYDIHGTSVSFSENEEPYFAVLAHYSSASGLSMLCIFSPEQKLVYKELTDFRSGLLAFRPKGSTGEVLLTGSGPVFEYSLKDNQ